MSKSAYTLDEAAVEVGLSRRTLEREIADSRLVPSYYRTKPLILHDELQRWLHELPLDPPRKSD